MFSYFRTRFGASLTMLSKLWSYLVQTFTTPVGMSPNELESANQFGAPRTLSAPQQRSSAIPYTPTRQAHAVLFRKECEIRICPALADEALRTKSNVSPALSYTGGAQAPVRERIFDQRDTEIDFHKLLHAVHRVAGDNERQSNDNDDDYDRNVSRIDAGNRALVVEVALVVLDPTWLSGNVYLRIDLTDVAPGLQSTHIFGNQRRVLANYAPVQQPAQQLSPLSTVHSAAPESQSPHRLGGACSLNHAADTVLGWCTQCGLEPNTVTLYQAPLGDADLGHYYEEICAPSGTHQYVKRVGNPPAPLEVSSTSTIARDLSVKQSEGAVVQDIVTGIDPHDTEQQQQRQSGGAGIVFVDQAAWNEEITTARRRVLVNLPLTDLARARIRIAARGTESEVNGTLKQVIIAVQIMEFVRIR